MYNTKSNSFSRFMFATLTAAMFGVCVPVHAAETLLGPVSGSVNNVTPFATTPIDASGYMGMTLTFNYEAETLDNGDVFTYGWSSNGVDYELGSFAGVNEGGPVGDETGEVVVALPPEASVGDLSVYVVVTANTLSDTVNFTNLTLTGTLIPYVDPDADGDGIPDSIDLCLGTMPDTFPHWGRAQGHFSWDGEVWVATERGPVNFIVDMEYTYGCSGTQILDELTAVYDEDFSGLYKHGVTKSILELWNSQAF